MKKFACKQYPSFFKSLRSCWSKYLINAIEFTWYLKRSYCPTTPDNSDSLVSKQETLSSLWLLTFLICCSASLALFCSCCSWILCCAWKWVLKEIKTFKIGPMITMNYVIFGTLSKKNTITFTSAISFCNWSKRGEGCSDLFSESLSLFLTSSSSFLRMCSCFSYPAVTSGVFCFSISSCLASYNWKK